MRMENNVYVPHAVPFFAFGFLYYFVSPYISLLMLDHLPLVMIAQGYLDINFFDIFYWIDAVAVFLAFVSGYFLSVAVISTRSNFLSKYVDYSILPNLICSGLLAFLFLAIYQVYSGGGRLFTGYQTYDIAVLGPVATVVFMAALFWNYFSKNSAKIMFGILFAFSSIVLLGFGSRMFFILGVIAIGLGLLSSRRYLLRSLRFYLVLLVLIFAVLSIGVWRTEGAMDGSLSDMMFSIFLIEPLFTMTSYSSFLSAEGGRPELRVPLDALASVINFVPSFIFPKKLELINSFAFDVSRFSPFGASALMANLYSNFGMLFPIYVFTVGSFYGYVRQKSYNSSFFRAVYFSTLPILMFHFYREGFITVFKIMFFNGFILPLLVILLFGYLLRVKA